MSLFGKMRGVALAVFIFTALVGCGGGSQSGTTAVQTVKFQPDGHGYLQYLTNDAQNYSLGCWYTIPSTWETQMTTTTALLQWDSGSRNGGHGILFCYQDTNNFYRVLFDALGHYTVSVKVGGTYSLLIPWTSPSSAVINTGVATNVVSVTQQTLHTFTISFNGIPEAEFTDQNFTGGESGFYMYTSPAAYESFPWIPEDVRFKMTSPITYPVTTLSGIAAAPASSVSSLEVEPQGARSDN